MQLNNVGGGGHVIFPSLNISVAPRKGDALLWSFKPGRDNKYLIHTVCPVYVGNCTGRYLLVKMEFCVLYKNVNYSYVH